MRKGKLWILRLETVPNGACDRHNGNLKDNGSSDRKGAEIMFLLCSDKY